MKPLTAAFLCAAFFGSIPLFAPATVAKDNQAAVVAPADLSVAIAAPEHFGKRSIDAGGTFNIVLSNTAKHEVRVWREWCSWGYFQLSFVVRDADDKDAEQVVIRKKGRGWDKNYPDYWTLAPGEPLVWPVKLESGDWDLGPLEGKLRGRKLAVKAVFMSDKSSQSEQDGVWSGNISSAERISC